MAVIFLSYRRDDSAGHAGRLHESLERRLGGGQVFRDVDALEPGQNFEHAIRDRLRECRAFLAVIGREWLGAVDSSGRHRLDLQDDFVRLETAVALSRPDLLVVPVLVEGMTMPAAEELPDSMRALTARQAISLRDETWDSDVDRLVTAVRKAVGADLRTSAPEIARRFKWPALAVVGIAALLLARQFTRTAPDPTTPVIERADAPRSAVTTAASAIAIPRVSEVVDGSLIYTLLSGDVSTRADRTTVRFRFRFSNGGASGANFWDDSFRLAVPGSVLAPTSGLSDYVPGYTLRQGVVTFDAPAGATRAVLRVLNDREVAELAIDLSPTGVPSEIDREDGSDALSRAIVRPIMGSPRTLVGGDVDYLLTNAHARRFVNTLRLVFSLRVTNRTKYPVPVDSNALRLSLGDKTIAPVVGPNIALEGNSATPADFVFDVPPTTAQVVLHAALPGAAPDVTFDLRSLIR